MPIILSGEENMIFNANMTFEDPGFTAYDRKGNNVTDSVKVSVKDAHTKRKSCIKPYLPGEYIICYSLKTKFGIVEKKIRKVKIKAINTEDCIIPDKKTIFLTFDDGPGKYTEKLLNILEKYPEVKVTFFVTNQFEGTDDKRYIDIITREHNEGHMVAIHTYSHDYKSVYSSIDNYFDDLKKIQNLILEKTGIRTKMLRFPGGTSNTCSSFNPGIMTELSKAMPSMGYAYFDWNVDSRDAGKTGISPSEIFDNVIKGIEPVIERKGYAIVLQHDIRENSIDAVDLIIKWGMEKGYVFSTLNMSSPGARHKPQN